jgi:hypothetical protein
MPEFPKPELSGLYTPDTFELVSSENSAESPKPV